MVNRPFSFLAIRWAVVCLSVGLISTPALAQLFDDTEARKAIVSLRSTVVQQGEHTQTELARMQSQIDQLQRSLLQSSTAQEALRSEMAQLNGHIEILTQEGQRHKDRAQQLELTVQQMLADGEKKPQAAADVPQPGFEPAQEALAKTAYEQALGKFRARDFAGAMVDFSTMIKAYPQSPLVASAQFWLGNAHYAQGRLKPAIAVLSDFIARNPQHTSTPDALLTLAEAQLGSADSAGGKASLEKLIKIYPAAKAATLAKERLAVLR